tara:strand:- start:655 stop:921 length:267 start_codon:yes stop_codon:yes gene_type:complete
MTITNKDSILKKYYEANGQMSMFGYDNLEFKTINHPRPHKFSDLCSEFKLKKTAAHAAAAELPFVPLSSLKVFKHKTAFHVNLPLINL